MRSMNASHNVASISRSPSARGYNVFALRSDSAAATSRSASNNRRVSFMARRTDTSRSSACPRSRSTSEPVSSRSSNRFPPAKEPASIFAPAASSVARRSASCRRTRCIVESTCSRWAVICSSRTPGTSAFFRSVNASLYRPSAACRSARSRKRSVSRHNTFCARR